MITLLRKHRQWLMIVIVILALPFCIYFVKTDYSAIRPDDFGRIYNRNISLVEARRDARLFDLARALGMSTFGQDLSAGAKSEAEAYVPFILNLIILRHEAARLGIWPTVAGDCGCRPQFGSISRPVRFRPSEVQQLHAKLSCTEWSWRRANRAANA